MDKPANDLPIRSRLLSPAWWLRDEDGNLVLAQLPNPPILIWMATVAIGWTDVLNDRDEKLLTTLGRGALLAWAVDEVLRGSSPFRRLLGMVVAVGLLIRLFG